MEAAGLIRRVAETGDSRFRRIHLTDAGRAAHDRAWPAMTTMRDTMLSALDPQDRETLNTMLMRIFYDIRHHDF